MANNIYTSITRNPNLINRRNRRTFVSEGNLFPNGGGLWNGGNSGFIPFDSSAAAKDVELVRGIQFNPSLVNTSFSGGLSLNQQIARDGYNPGTMKQQIDSLTTPPDNSGSTKSVSFKPTTMQAIGMASNFMDSIPTGDKRGMWDTLDPVYHLAGGRESGVGNAMSDAGVSLTKAGLLSGLPYMAIAGAALKVVGGLANAAFGIKENTARKQAVELGISQNSNFVSKATSFDDVKGPAGVMTNTDVYEGGWFSGGKAARKNAELADRMITAKQWADRSVVNNISNIADDLMNTALQNYAAFGGPIDVDPSTAIGYSIYTDKFMKDRQKTDSGMTNMFAGTPAIFGFGGGIYTKGANFDTGVSFINKGGTHELNPNDGVPMGVDSLGIPNLVEEGEVRWGDYMFSDRLIVPRGKRGNYGKRVRKYAEGGKLVKGKGIDTPYESKVLKPYEGLTFADAAKKILKRNGADERDDAITMRGIDAELSVLAGILEKEREKEKLREMQETIDNMSPEEFAMLLQQMEAQLAALQQQEMAMQLQLMIPEGMELMVPQELMAAAYGGPIYELGGLLNNWDVAPAVQTSTIETPIAENRYDFGSWLLKINPALYNEYLKEVKFRTEELAPYIQRMTAADPNYNYAEDNEAPVYGEYNPLVEKLKEFYEGATGGDAEEHWSNKVQTNVEDANIRAKNFDDLTSADINNIFGWEASTPVEKPSEGTTSKEIKSAAKVEGPEAEVFDFYNRRHPDAPKSVEQWNALKEKEKAEYIRAYRKTLKDKKEDFDKRLDDYNKQQELNDKVAKYQEQLAKSSVNLDDLKDISYDNLERIAEVVNPNYTKKSLQGLSVDDEKKAVEDLRNNIVEWAKDNEKGTLEYLNKAFGAPEAHNSWARTALDDETRWTPSGYDYDEFKTRTANYNGSLTPGNLAGNYAPDADFDLGDFQDVNALEADLSYKNYTDKVRDAIERNKDVKFRFKEGENPSYAAIEYADGSPTLSEDDYNTLRLLSRLVERTKTNPNGEYVPIFNIDDNGYRSFNQEIKHNNKTYTPWEYFNHLRNDQVLGAMHLTPKENKGSELYTLNDKDYYKLSDIEAKTPDWLKYYIEDPKTTTLKDGTIVHKLSYQNPLNFKRATGTPEDVEVKPDGTYVVKGSEENDPFPKAASWPFAVAAGLLLGSLGYNILKPADYSNADALLNASRDAGVYKPVEFRPIGNYLPYKPLDIWYEQNRLNANARATDRAILNSGANQGSKAAALLASGYNNQLASGNLFRQALEYNDALRKQVGEFNKDTDKFNSEGFLKADMANQDAATRAAGYTLEGKRASYAMRQAIDDAKANAINVGLSGLANLAYNYAGNKYNQDLLGWGMRHNAWGPGVSYKSSKGGKIRRKRGIGF